MGERESLNKMTETESQKDWMQKANVFRSLSVEKEDNGSRRSE